jgi:hypothetical protein
VILVFALQPALLAVRELSEGITCPGPRRAVAIRYDDGTGDREIGPDSGERLEHLLLGIVQAPGEGANDHHEPDAHCEAERRERGAPRPPAELCYEVAEVEHGGGRFPSAV